MIIYIHIIIGSVVEPEPIRAGLFCYAQNLFIELGKYTGKMYLFLNGLEYN